MEQNTTEGQIKTAHTAEAEKSNGATDTTLSLGKFTSVEALYRAYERLDAEFTRRSQRLRALEEGIAEKQTKDTRQRALSDNSAIGENDFRGGDGETERKTASDVARSAAEEENKPDGVFPSADDKKGDYIDELIKHKSPASFCKGNALYAPPYKPKTLAEAGELAREFIKMKGEI